MFFHLTHNVYLDRRTERKVQMLCEVVGTIDAGMKAQLCYCMTLEFMKDHLSSDGEVILCIFIKCAAKIYIL